jgi:mono/diheme cytochrome c family protein
MSVLVAALLWLAGPGETSGEEPRPGPPATTHPFGGDRGVIAEGRSSFNVHCSHCHAPNAENPDPRTDLRRLRLRYGETMTQVFYATVTEGRPTKGMPPWKASLNEETIRKILTFLESVQKEP